MREWREFHSLYIGEKNMVRKLKGKKVSRNTQSSEEESERIRAEIRQQLGITEQEERQIYNYIDSKISIGDKRSYEELFREGYTKLIEEDNLRRAKRREQLRKDLEITEEEEKEIYNYIQEQQKKEVLKHSMTYSRKDIL